MEISYLQIIFIAIIAFIVHEILLFFRLLIVINRYEEQAEEYVHGVFYKYEKLILQTVLAQIKNYELRVKMNGNEEDKQQTREKDC